MSFSPTGTGAQRRTILAILLTLLALAATLQVAPKASAAGTVMYSSIPASLPGNVISQAFQAQQASEFGDRITFEAGTGDRVASVSIVMSSWGCESGHWNTGDCLTTPGATFSHPITLTLYQDGGATPGAVIATQTKAFDIPYRPSASGSCTGGRWFSSAHNACYNGLATTITFDFPAPGVLVPATIVWGVAYNTSNWGYAPIGASTCSATLAGCGYDSLNVGAESLALIGTDVDPNGAFFNTATAAWYCDGGVSGTGLFRLDDGCWTGNRPMAEFNAPLPQCTTTCYADAVNGNNANGGTSAADAKKTIQAAVNQVNTGGTVYVLPGLYIENVSIAKNIQLLSTAGRAVTTIQALPDGNAINVSNNTTALTIGAASAGFTVLGSDGASPAVERAAIYFAGPHSGAKVVDNNVVAGGDAGLMTEFGAVISGFVIDGNEFSGQTFVGPNPAGAGFGLQFTLPNVPRQLVVISGGNGGGNTSNITFKNNVVSGTAGGMNTDVTPAQQGNNLVTIDAAGSTITGNAFTGFTNRFAHSLRVRGPNAVVSKNTFTAGSPFGVWVGALAAGTSSVTRNAIVGNGIGLYVDGATTLAATCNWYGSASGPTNAGNPGGTGDIVYGPATFSPWLITSDLDGPCPNGAPDLEIDSPVDGAIFAVGASVSLTSSYEDATPLDAYSCSIDWGDATTPTSPSAGSGGTGTCDDSHSYSSPGVYTISVTVTDGGGASDTESIMLVVYDPTAGFVTGGGWFMSPAGAYVDDENLTGKASFGFVSKYQKGKTVPTGNTEFQFKAAGLNFSSTSYDWLVVAGARAQFKGTGTINGAGTYRFILTAIDGQVSGGGGSDKFRIRIWDDVGGGLVYDNMLSAPDSDNPTTTLGGGQIVIHK